MIATENKTEAQSDSLRDALQAAPEYAWEKNTRNGACGTTGSGTTLNFIQYEDGRWYWGVIARRAGMDGSGIVATRREAIAKLIAWAKAESQAAVKESWKEREARVAKFGAALKRGTALTATAEPGIGTYLDYVYVELQFASMADAEAYFSGSSKCQS